MRIVQLQLLQYRNFGRLEIELPPGPAVFVGDNARGKSNLLEAIYLLATMRAPRAETDVQLIRRESLSDVLAAARVVAQAQTLAGDLKLEVAITARAGAQGPVAGKTVRVNGVPKRLTDAVGRLTAVLFSADDLDLISGSPSLRRGYLDTTLAQVDREYLTARQRFERVLLQRNHLLKRIREGEARPDEISFWDQELTTSGGLIFHRRAAALTELRDLARELHSSLAPDELLGVHYQPRLEGAVSELDSATPAEVTDAYASALRRGLSRDIAAGMTLQGPHRDDLLLTLNGLPASAYASRAQQRTIALSLRLSEARLLRLRRGEPPVLLLDDILSEMDAVRRHSVLSALADADQILITGTDWDRFPSTFLSQATLFSVDAETVRPLVTDPSGRQLD